MSEPTQAEKVCQQLCDLFEDPNQWRFDFRGFIGAITPIYRQARDVIRPPKLPNGEPKTAHEFARALLAGPDNRIILAAPVFDMPGQMVALPVVAEPLKVEGVDCVVVRPQPST